MPDMLIVHAEHDKKICLGREGENRARQVVFDLYNLMERYGDNGVVELIAQRPGDAEPYPCVVEVEDGHAVWTITSADTAKPGYGKCELVYIVGEQIVKTEVFGTVTMDALGEPGEAPEPYQGWLDDILAAGADAEAERVKAETARDAAEESARNAAGSAEAALLAKQTAEKAAQETETARAEAVNAATSAGEDAAYAEKSRLAAEDAQRLTEQAAAEVELAKTEVDAAQEVVEQALTDTIAEREAAEAARDQAEKSAADAAESAEITTKAATIIEELINGSVSGGSGLLLTDTETGVLYRLQVTGGKLRMMEVSNND